MWGEESLGALKSPWCPSEESLQRDCTALMLWSQHSPGIPYAHLSFLSLAPGPHQHLGRWLCKVLSQRKKKTKQQTKEATKSHRLPEAVLLQQVQRDLGWLTFLLQQPSETQLTCTTANRSEINLLWVECVSSNTVMRNGEKNGKDFRQGCAWKQNTACQEIH